MWRDRERLAPQKGWSLSAYYTILLGYNGMGRFIAAQIVADLKYVAPLKDAKDWWTFVASGPGSRKGMSYLLGESPQMKWKEHEWCEAARELSVLMKPITEYNNMPRLHAQDLQNCCCEFSKYMRTRLGTGRPKQRFTPFIEDV
jgi:hypothetical protein